MNIFRWPLEWTPSPCIYRVNHRDTYLEQQQTEKIRTEIRDVDKIRISKVYACCPGHRVHRVATAAFWRTFSDEGKICPGWWGWGVHAHPLLLNLPSPLKLECTLQLSGQIHWPCFISTNMCTLWSRVHGCQGGLLGGHKSAPVRHEPPAFRRSAGPGHSWCLLSITGFFRVLQSATSQARLKGGRCRYKVLGSVYRNNWSLFWSVFCKIARD